MKTISTLLITCILYAGTCTTVLAADNTRSEKNNRQKTEVKITNRRTATADRNQVSRSKTRVSTDRSQVSRSKTRATTVRRTEVRIPARTPDRNIRVTTTKYKNHNHGLHIIGRLTFRSWPIFFHTHRDRNRNYSLKDLAWMETDRLVLALNLNNHQRNGIYRINYSYLKHQYRGDYYPESRRNREIRRFLLAGQIMAFAVILNEIHNDEVSYNYSYDNY